MEQWNEFGYELSLKKLMELSYTLKVLDERGLDVDYLKGKNLAEVVKEIEELELNDMDKDNITNSKDNYIKYQKEVLFKILDTIIDDSAKKLSCGNTGRYYFNQDNCEFILRLLDNYQLKVYDYSSIANGEYGRPNTKPSEYHYTYKCLKNKEYDQLCDSDLDCLYEGLINLAKNEKTNLQIEEVNRAWNLRFKPILKEILDLLEHLTLNIEFCKIAINVEGVNLEKLENIKKILKKCNDELNIMCKEAIQIIELDSGAESEPDSDSDLDSNMEELLMEPFIQATKWYVVNEHKRKKYKK